MVFNCFSEVKREFVDDADYYKVTLVTSQAYQDGFTVLYALKCSTHHGEQFKNLLKIIQINLGTRMKEVVIISHEVKESLMVTLAKE